MENISISQGYDKTWPKEDGDKLFHSLASQGYNFFTGVPCSYFKSFLSELEKTNFPHVRVPLESQAVGVAFGALMAGKKPIVYCQNSAIGYITNPITSLLIPCGVDITFVISERYKPAQHEVMGRTGRNIMRLIGYDHNVLWVVDSNNTKNNIPIGEFGEFRQYIGYNGTGSQAEAPSYSFDKEKDIYYREESENKMDWPDVNNKDNTYNNEVFQYNKNKF